MGKHLRELRIRITRRRDERRQWAVFIGDKWQRITKAEARRLLA